MRLRFIRGLAVVWLSAFLLGPEHFAVGQSSVAVDHKQLELSPIHSGQICIGMCAVIAEVVIGDATAGNVTAVLPVTRASFNPVEACKTDTSTNSVTLYPTGTDTIDGSRLGYALSEQNQCVKLVDTTIGNWSVQSERYAVWPVNKGGTGATDARAARTNLGLGALATLGAGTGLSSDGTNLNLGNTPVTAGSYTNANITVNEQGQITNASNGNGTGIAIAISYLLTDGL